MFVLTIVPLPLSKDSNNVAANKFSRLDVSEHRIMELEAALSQLLLVPRGELSYIEGATYEVNESDENGNPIKRTTADANTLRQLLEQAKAENLQLRSQLGNIVDDDSTERIKEINGKLIAANMRLQDLQNLQRALTRNPNADLPEVSGVTYEVAAADQSGPITRTTTDANTLQQAINQTMAYQKELQNANSFWSQIVNSHNEQERPIQKRKGDINDDGKINKADVNMLKDAISGKIKLTDEQRKVADMNDDNKIDYDDVQALKKTISDGVKPAPKSYLGQIEYYTNKIMELMNNPKIKDKSAVVSLRSKLCKALRRYTNQPETTARKNAIVDFFRKITKGDLPDSNMDGKTDFYDVINIWNSADTSPRPTENR